MRKVTFGVANSLDNYIAREDDAVDWLLWCDEAKAVMQDYWKKVDAIVMGRKTWDVSRRMAAAGDASSFGGMTTYVVSRTLAPEDTGPGAELVSGDPVDFLRALKEAPGREIVLMGGGELANPLLEAGLVDEIGFNIHPVLLGAGIPLFHPMKRQLDLELIECRPFSNGCVYVTYRVLP